MGSRPLVLPVLSLQALQQKDDLAERVRVLEVEESRHLMLLGQLESRLECHVEPRSLLSVDSNQALPKTQVSNVPLVCSHNTHNPLPGMGRTRRGS